MSNLSIRDAFRLAKKAQSLQVSSKRAREKLGGVTKDLVRAAEVSAVSAGLGYWQGKRAAAGNAPLKIAGVPADLLVGVAGHVLGIVGVGGAEEHWKAFGDAGLATYFSTAGYSAGKSGTKLLSGSPAGVSGASLTAEDLARLANG